jgi:hypothetical protein
LLAALTGSRVLVVPFVVNNNPETRDRGRRSFPAAAGWSFARRGTAVACRALAQPKPDLSDFGRLKVPNSGRPEFGVGEGTMVGLRTRMGEGFLESIPSPIVACSNIERPSPARGEGTITATTLALLLTMSNSPSRSRDAFSAPGLCKLCFANPNRGVGGAPRDVRVRAKHPLGLHMTRQPRRLRGALRPIARQDARERAYDAGRSPLGAPPWRF